ncbi:hypothetical protein [Streptomyces eurocidicus]|uniref:Uncharacterized protein n=1 Tax=Streptomyces eurocidicus TaxID=66423 RepID=A0A7W8F4C6_STREU|nr:hypothetical protein [Streptomyces eurocidicus]MBB5122733.1 hypothetical protein [Streptomyces eurocidicus]
MAKAPESAPVIGMGTGAGPSPFESEVAFDGGIPWKYVTRIWKKDEFGEMDFDYDDPIWER